MRPLKVCATQVSTSQLYLVPGTGSTSTPLHAVYRAVYSEEHYPDAFAESKRSHMLHRLLLLALLGVASGLKVAVTGAGGKTGSLLFKRLIDDPATFDPLAVVRSRKSSTKKLRKATGGKSLTHPMIPRCDTQHTQHINHTHHIHHTPSHPAHPSPPHHHPITTPSPPHHHPITIPSPPYHHPITTPSPPHHHPITL